MSDRMKTPPNRDCGFYQGRKHGKWQAVPAPTPTLEGPVADSHAHVHMLDDPAWEFVRCAANGVRFVCEICDPADDDPETPAQIRAWHRGCEEVALRIAAGVHPHHAQRYDDVVEERLIGWLGASEVGAVGEIGLDYHYDLSPRDVQRAVFRRQIEIAKELDLPIALHLRGGEAPDGEAASSDNAHREAIEILSEVGFPRRGTILHCCTLGPDELRPWVEAGCYIAYGGALTFKKSHDARAGALIVPDDRLLLETDSPYMAPEPMRGVACTPAHVVFTAACLAELRGHVPGEDRRRFLAQLHANTLRFFGA